MATGTEPSRAYRLFQIGEELGRINNGIDTIDLAERVRAMHEPTYFAAASRGRDRRTLRFDAMLIPAVQGDSGSGPPGLGSLALYPLAPRSGWRTGVTACPPCLQRWPPVSSKHLPAASAHRAMSRPTGHRVPAFSVTWIRTRR